MKKTIPKFPFQVSPATFEAQALQTFQYQAQHNKVYKAFIHYLSINPAKVKCLQAIPFLPIELFKTQTILTGEEPPVMTFTSSGTTGQQPSRHAVIDLQWYERSFLQGFKHFYGAIQNYCILALLPTYLEREGSSLIYMVNQLIQQSQHPLSAFYLREHEKLVQTLQTLEYQKQPTILLGVSYALWELAEKYPMPLRHTIVMETGGMKGRRKELIRPALHKIFQDAFGIQKVHSEYGMTELLSQAYSKGEGLFDCPPWMKVSIREVNDPFQELGVNRVGGINIIDLANVHSCSFIATQDLGRVTVEKKFEVLGRFDTSDVRGCNLLVG